MNRAALCWSMTAAAWITLSTSPMSHAQQVSTQSTRIQATAVVPHDASQAQAWGLHADEWSRYEQLMRGPLGIASPNLDPLTALGIEARSDAERRRYAELQVHFEAQRVQKELAYQLAYDAAWKRLYPTMQPVHLQDTAASPAVAASTDATGRLAVFVRDQCPACDAKVQALQTQGLPFDIYVVGSRGDDSAIRQWARRVGLDPAKVRARTITLNHDAGRWLSLGDQSDLPAVLKEDHGQWSRQ
ncbi:TIGR03759 family integrating conjugative element protein [Burkholderia sp. Bp9012]|uniref:TIGR03759 family integrating conjugative element protein n=1 Tax=Burkholderia sp. Bp9012 TaxID=2184562 RepID=UPI000F59893B|nr:TIGR03759 family integrating conjugative element protein [Burkholderia sp. Bp9012]RQR79183.1 TIGR03759 family integrating conjugative element protein [Burkholderia sp. Bp9012]